MAEQGSSVGSGIDDSVSSSTRIDDAVSSTRIDDSADDTASGNWRNMSIKNMKLPSFLKGKNSGDDDDDDDDSNSNSNNMDSKPNSASIDIHDITMTSTTNSNIEKPTATNASSTDAEAADTKSKRIDEDGAIHDDRADDVIKATAGDVIKATSTSTVVTDETIIEVNVPKTNGELRMFIEGTDKGLFVTGFKSGIIIIIITIIIIVIIIIIIRFSGSRARHPSSTGRDTSSRQLRR